MGSNLTPRHSHPFVSDVCRHRSDVRCCIAQSFDVGGASRTPSSARSARTTRSNWASNVAFSHSQPVKSAASRDLTSSDSVGSVFPSQSTVWRDHKWGENWAKGPGGCRRSPNGSPQSQAITRTTGMAVAVRSCWRWVRAEPTSRLRRRSMRRIPCDRLLSTPARSAYWGFLPNPPQRNTSARASAARRRRRHHALDPADGRCPARARRAGDRAARAVAPTRRPRCCGH